MDVDLDTLAMAPYGKTGDLLKASPQMASRRPALGITPKLSDAELVTLAVMQAAPTHGDHGTCPLSVAHRVKPLVAARELRTADKFADHHGRLRAHVRRRSAA